MKTAKEILESMLLYQQMKLQKEIIMNQQQKVMQILNATIVTGQYIDKQGMQKKSYLTIGTLFIYQDGGMSLKLDAMPTNGQNIVFYPRKPKEQNQANQNYNNNNNGGNGGNGQSYNQNNNNYGGNGGY